MKVYVAPLFISIFFVLSCHGGNAVVALSTSDSMLAGTWQLQYITAPQVSFDGLFPSNKPTLVIDIVNKKVSGNTGCNSYRGKFSADNTSIHFDESIAVTEMMCAEGEAGEKTYLTMLGKTNHYDIKNDTLQLLEDRRLLMQFTKK